MGGSARVQFTIPPHNPDPAGPERQAVAQAARDWLTSPEVQQFLADLQGSTGIPDHGVGRHVLLTVEWK